jgi:CRP-like cAMP-binding protein
MDQADGKEADRLSLSEPPYQKSADDFTAVQSLVERMGCCGNYVYEVVSTGGLVGEMALVDGGPRSATVRAIEPSTVIPIHERRFLFMVQQTPFFALRLMRVMTARLRAMDERAKAA